MNLAGVSGRFWSKVNRQGPVVRPELGPCWTWTAAIGGGGYGRVRQRKGPAVYAHRFSWELHNGLVPRGLKVLHRCDNPPCVRPEHLFLGTNRDNTRDMMRKGRGRHGRVDGEHNPSAKLRERDVVAILGSSKSNAELARLYGTTASLIGLIRARRVWGHLTVPIARARDGRRGKGHAEQVQGKGEGQGARETETSRDDGHSGGE